MVNVSGGWNPGYYDELLKRVVEYGAMTNNENSSAWRYPSGNQYSYDGNSNMKGWVIFLDSTVDVLRYMEAVYEECF